MLCKDGQQSIAVLLKPRQFVPGHWLQLLLFILPCYRIFRILLNTCYSRALLFSTRIRLANRTRSTSAEYFQFLIICLYALHSAHSIFTQLVNTLDGTNDYISFSQIRCQRKESPRRRRHIEYPFRKNPRKVTNYYF